MVSAMPNSTCVVVLVWFLVVYNVLIVVVRRSGYVDVCHPMIHHHQEIDDLIMI